jgi:hypothetical protein
VVGKAAIFEPGLLRRGKLWQWKEKTISQLLGGGDVLIVAEAIVWHSTHWLTIMCEKAIRVYAPRRTQGGIAIAIADPTAQPSIPWMSVLCKGMKTLRRRGLAMGSRWLTL